VPISNQEAVDQAYSMWSRSDEVHDFVWSPKHREPKQVRAESENMQ
jgi:hypothetical protein